MTQIEFGGDDLKRLIHFLKLIDDQNSSGNDLYYNRGPRIPNTKRGSSQGIIISEGAKDERRFKFLGFYCSVEGCDWNVDPKLQFFEAINEFGKHKLELHPNNKEAKIVRHYEPR